VKDRGPVFRNHGRLACGRSRHRRDNNRRLARDQGGDVPELDRVVLRGGDDRLAVGGEGDAGNAVLVARQVAELDALEAEERG
jgi:hypothetical protein